MYTQAYILKYINNTKKTTNVHVVYKSFYNYILKYILHVFFNTRKYITHDYSQRKNDKKSQKT